MTLPYIICNRNIKNYIQKGLFNEIKNLKKSLKCGERAGGGRNRKTAGFLRI